MNFSEFNEFKSKFEFDHAGKPVKYKGHKIIEWKECPIHGTYAKRFRVQYSENVYDDYDVPNGCLTCLREQIVQDSIGFKSIPLRYRSKSFDNFEHNTKEQECAYNAAKRFVSDSTNNLRVGRCLILCGGVGTGKTHLACSIANALNSQGCFAVFTTVSKLIRSVRASWGTKDEQKVIDSFVDVDLLIIDEVGVQAGSDNEKNILFDVINGRYEQMKSTIIISNLNLQGIKEFLGERIVDRLRENGGTLIPFTGKSYR